VLDIVELVCIFFGYFYLSSTDNRPNNFSRYKYFTSKRL